VPDMADSARDAVVAALEMALRFDEALEDLTHPWELDIQRFWTALYEGGYEVVVSAHSDGSRGRTDG
jgi:hypothetical protein